MEKVKNRISVVSCGLGDVMLEELEVQGPCSNILEDPYGMRDILRILNGGTQYMYTNRYRVTSIQFGGSIYGSLRCHFAIEYYDDTGEHRVELFYHGDGMWYAYATLDSGEVFHTLFDDHNWRIEQECYIIHDMMEAFRKEFDKCNK